MKCTGKVRKEKDEESTLKEMLRDLRETINSQERTIREFTQKREPVENSSHRKFGRYVEAQLNELPPESAIELQSELQRLICEKRLQVLKKSGSFTEFPSTSEVSVTAAFPGVKKEFD